MDRQGQMDRQVTVKKARQITVEARWIEGCNG